MSDNRLNPAAFLEVGHLIISQNGQFTLVLQQDGNLVLSKKGHGVLWSTKTDFQEVKQTIMQADGNFVLYGPQHNRVYDTGTDGQGGSYLVIENDGYVVIYDPAGNKRWVKPDRPKRWRYFISYGDPDLKFARRLRKDLAANDMPCWMYDEDSTPGQRTQKEIADRLRSAPKVIVLCSSASLKRDGILKEIERLVVHHSDYDL